ALGVAVTMATSEVLDLDEEAGQPPSLDPSGERWPVTSNARPRSLDPEHQALRDRLEALLRDHGGNVSSVARHIGKAREQAHRLIKRLGLDAGVYRTAIRRPATSASWFGEDLKKVPER